MEMCNTCPFGSCHLWRHATLDFLVLVIYGEMQHLTFWIYGHIILGFLVVLTSRDSSKIAEDSLIKLIFHLGWVSLAFILCQWTCLWSLTTAHNVHAFCLELPQKLLDQACEHLETSSLASVGHLQLSLAPPSILFCCGLDTLMACTFSPSIQLLW